MHIYIIIGPSGVGKTTIGTLLSRRLNLPFYDADDFHPENNINKMKAGIPLCDEDRFPWLNTLSDSIKKWHTGTGAVVACSALKEKYRRQLMSIPDKYTTWIYLRGNESLIRGRLANRKRHFFNKELLSSQYSELEVPEYGCHIDVNKGPQDVVDEILECINKKK
ncbi:Gluconokinase [Fulvivirga imtechensis AK7]|uniref:Gluconokinase n=1 Tax=Fulvivirga imtechensis AK7 TaxID=1237149 RepID=L8K0G8_9BACT|nr:gluconokinase, GntK/IdnK-type [Fulvivirga imtechensis]ELR73429.1 Gluconokinase [Fulvivirga imtechensis AK7]